VPERKVKVPFVGAPNGVAEGSEVQILETTERWSEIRLQDGVVLRIKPTVLSAVRLEGMYDQEGNPLYALRSSILTATVSAPDILRKPTNEESKVQ
jgi:hypothetical protein